MDPYEEWLREGHAGDGDRPEATFVALAGGEVAGYAKLSLAKADTKVAYHDMTGVTRAFRGRGIAAALKRAQIRWAKEAGYEKLQTENEVRNEPIRRLNARHGYELQPGLVTCTDAGRAGCPESEGSRLQPATHSLLASRLQLALHLPLRVTIGDRAALVALVLPPAERDLDLHLAVLK